MRWPDVTQAIATFAAADVRLQQIYGGAIRYAGIAEFAVPSLEYTLIIEEKGVEIWSPIVIQWNQRTLTLDEIILSEQALMDLFDRRDEDMVEIEGVKMFAVYDDSADLTTPDRPNYSHRMVRFRFTPVRRPYVTQPS